MLEVAEGTIVVYSDVTCPWAHAAVYRLLDARARLGLDEQVVLDHRAFPLELFNDKPTPKRSYDAEIPVIAEITPAARWQAWSDADYRYPVTALLPLEAVQAAKQQGLRASEQLDREIRIAFFGESRCISMRHEILACAERCEDVDVDVLRDAIDNGRARRTLMEQFERARADDVQGSPHVFLRDGSSFHNPGIRHHLEGIPPKVAPVIDEDDASIYERILRAATSDTSR